MDDFMPSNFLERKKKLQTLEEKFRSTYADIFHLGTDIPEGLFMQFPEYFAAIDDHIAKALASKAATEHLYELDEKLFTGPNGVRHFRNLLKAQPVYKRSYGEDMGLEVPKQEFHPETLKPELDVKIIGGRVVIKFPKKGTDGVRIYCQRGEEPDFTFLALDTHSPYEDNRPNINAGKGEERSYYAFYVIKDKIIGQRSDIVTIGVSSVVI